MSQRGTQRLDIEGLQTFIAVAEAGGRHARAQGGRLHGIQAWVALPKEQEEMAPSFYHYSGGWLPKWSEPGVVGQLIAGNAYGLTAHAVTHSPLFYAHLDMEPGSTAEKATTRSARSMSRPVPWNWAVRLRRRADVGADPFASRTRALQHSAVMVLGGEPVGETFV